jgi:hypothetical protein
MDKIKRYIADKIAAKVSANKVILLLGARRVGKTFLLNSIKDSFNEPYRILYGEDINTNDQLNNKSIEFYKDMFSDTKLLIIDEAQKISNIGKILKIFTDNVEGLKIIATGSSAFDLLNKTGEPLTGRKYTFHLYPIAQCELRQYEDPILTSSFLEERLIYGAYPEVVLMKGYENKIEYLNELVSSYLLKDILELDGLKNSSKILQILKLLSYQVCSEVSLNEISRQVGLSKQTVEKYLDLLEKVFVIHKLSGFSRNLRKEVASTNKYYFWDNGIRNILAANFNPLNMRNDMGSLWENYIISERKKYQSYSGMIVYNYFWRTYEKQEIDFIEDREGQLFAYEIKYTKGKTAAPSAWSKAYPNSDFKLITKDDYLSFIS